MKAGRGRITVRKRLDCLGCTLMTGLVVPIAVKYCGQVYEYICMFLLVMAIAFTIRGANSLLLFYGSVSFIVGYFVFSRFSEMLWESLVDQMLTGVILVIIGVTFWKAGYLSRLEVRLVLLFIFLIILHLVLIHYRSSISFKQSITLSELTAKMFFASTVVTVIFLSRLVRKRYVRLREAVLATVLTSGVLLPICSQCVALKMENMIIVSLLLIVIIFSS